MVTEQGLLHIHLYIHLLNNVHKCTEIDDGIDVIDLKRLVGVYMGVYLIIHLLNFVYKCTNI